MVSTSLQNQLKSGMLTVEESTLMITSPPAAATLASLAMGNCAPSANSASCSGVCDVINVVTEGMGMERAHPLLVPPPVVSQWGMLEGRAANQLSQQSEHLPQSRIIG
jgi:hypothetical protein